MIASLTVFVKGVDVPQSTLYDIRDGKSYLVRKLADGNCWMVSDLALELIAGKVAIGSTNNRKTFEWTPVGSCGVNGSCPMNGNTAVQNGVGYYDWYAVTAGRGQYGDIDKDIDGSICPKGWKVPSNYSVLEYRSKSYENLLSFYGSTRSIVGGLPLNFGTLGHRHSGALYLNGEYAYYYSSTASSNQRFAYLMFWYTGSSAVSPSTTTDDKYSAIPVRCVALWNSAPTNATNRVAV